MFLGQELIPHLSQLYRVHPYCVLAGHSLAGYFSLNTLLAQPDLFDAYIASSPSVGTQAREALVQLRLDAAHGKSWEGKFLFFSIGSAESAEAVEAIARLTQSFEGRPELGLRLATQVYEGEGHIPFKGAYDGLRTLLPPRAISSTNS